MIVGSDLNAEDFIDDSGLLSENISEVQAIKKAALSFWSL